MKRKEQNPEKDMYKDLEYLEKKLGEEKENLVRENKKLQKQIHQEIQQNRLYKQSFEKKQQSYQQKIQLLAIENQNLKTQILLNSENEDHDLEFERKLKETCQAYKLLTSENEELKSKLEEYAELIAKMEEDIQELQRENSKYKRKVKDDELEIKNLAKEISKNKQYYLEFQNESEKTVEELERQIEANGKLENTISQLKKKNKQFNTMIRELETKLEEVTRKEQEEFDHQIGELRREKEIVEKTIMEKQRQLEFLRISDSQKTQYIETINKEIEDLRNNLENTTKDNNSLSSNLQKVENQNRRLQIQQQREKSKAEKEIEELQKSHQEELQKFKRKTAEDVSSLFRSGGDSKMIENYVQGLRSHKSQMNLRINPSAPLLKSHEQKMHIPFQKLKYETQISNLHSEIDNIRRQLESANGEINKLKKLNQENKGELETRSFKIKELNLMIEKVENEKKFEEDRHYKEMIKYRNIQTQLLENRRNSAQLEEAMGLKISYYDKKIKDYLDAIDRKDSMIENLKIQRTQAENKWKFMQDKLAKSIEQVQNLRKFKSDTTRKQQILKDYKQKIQRLKTEIETTKSELQKVKKQKTRLQRNLQSKQQYINSLKIKSQKQDQQRQTKMRQSQSLAIQNLKQKYQAKLKKLKKQMEEFQNIIQSMRVVIAQKIQQAIKKAGVQTEAQSTKWEAAELLGLKSSQIQEFVNPTAHLDRNICEDLDNLWESGKYEEFMRSSIEYILLKNEADDPEID